MGRENEMDNNMENWIDTLIEYIDGCKSTPLSGGKVSVPKEEYISMLEELKSLVPRELERSRDIIAKKDSILAEAQAKADALVNNAAKEAGLMIDENEIVALANMRADEIISKSRQKAAEILDQAEEEAEGIQLGAMQYTSAMLNGLETMFQNLFDNQKEQFEGVVGGLEKNLEKIKANHAEIDTQLALWTNQDGKKEEEEEE
jgi:cell division septum initiation protein DivIVA